MVLGIEVIPLICILLLLEVLLIPFILLIR